MTTRTHVFVDIFTKTSKFCETVFVSKFGAQVELFDQKRVDILVTLSLYFYTGTVQELKRQHLQKNVIQKTST